jgi:hypothetical protein
LINIFSRPVTVPDQRTGTGNQFFSKEQELVTSSFERNWNWSLYPVLGKRTGHCTQFSGKELVTVPSSHKKNWELSQV